MKTSIAKGEEEARGKGEEFGYREMLDKRIAELVKKQ
jgi:hypothetical protein